MGKTKKKKNVALSVDCNYCYSLKSNIESKLFCKDCEKRMVKECTNCHFPLPSKESFFLEGKGK